MEGILLSLDREEKKGRVDTRTEEYKELTIYFQEIPEGLKESDAVTFDVVTSQKSGRPYAKFFPPVAETPVEEPPAEDAPEPQEDSKPQQYFETYRKFVEEFGLRLGLTLRANPLSRDDVRVNSLCDFTHGRYADLQLNNIPFFTAGRYKYGGTPYDPIYTVTLDKRYYDMRKRYFSDCDVYFHVNWTMLEHDFTVSDGMRHGRPNWHTVTFRVQPLDGVWKTSFAALVEKIESRVAVLCHRRIDPRSQPTGGDPVSEDFYLFDLNDQEVFERLL